MTTDVSVLDGIVDVPGSTACSTATLCKLLQECKTVKMDEQENF